MTCQVFISSHLDSPLAALYYLSFTTWHFNIVVKIFVRSFIDFKNWGWCFIIYHFLVIHVPYRIVLHIWLLLGIHFYLSTKCILERMSVIVCRKLNDSFSFYISFVLHWKVQILNYGPVLKSHVCNETPVDITFRRK